MKKNVEKKKQKKLMKIITTLAFLLVSSVGIAVFVGAANKTTTVIDGTYVDVIQIANSGSTDENKQRTITVNVYLDEQKTATEIRNGKVGEGSNIEIVIADGFMLSSNHTQDNLNGLITINNDTVFNIYISTSYNFNYMYYDGTSYVKDTTINPFQSDQLNSDLAIQNGVKTVEGKTYSYVGRTVSGKTVDLFYVCYNDFISVEKTILNKDGVADVNGQYTLNFNVKSVKIPLFKLESKNKIVLVIDTSASMASSVGASINESRMASTYEDTRWYMLVNTVSDFLNTVLANNDNLVSVVTYAGGANNDYIKFTGDKEQINNYLNTFFNKDMFDKAYKEKPNRDVTTIASNLRSGTNIAGGLKKASSVLAGDVANSSVILMTDGAANRNLQGVGVDGSVAAADAATQGNLLAAQGATIYSIAMINGTLDTTVNTAMGKGTFAKALYQASQYDVLKTYFASIATSISGMNINAITIQDNVNDNFKVVSGQSNIIIDKVNSQIVTIPVTGITTEGTDYTFKIEPTDITLTKTGSSYTNGSLQTFGLGCDLKYTTVDGSSITKRFEQAPVAIIKPKANDDLYTTNQDTVLNVTIENSLLKNDIATALNASKTNAKIGVKEETITTTNGGSVSIKADGTFEFKPAVGSIETDTFNYTEQLTVGNLTFDSIAKATVSISPKRKITVNYLDTTNNNAVIIPPTIITGSYDGNTVAITYENIPTQYKVNKVIMDNTENGVILPTNVSLIGHDTVINIYYELKAYNYTVKYLEKDTNRELKTAKTAVTARFAATVIETPVLVAGYTADAQVKSIASISVNEKENEIIFYYTANQYSYTVKYLEKDTNKELATPKIVLKAIFETKVTESAAVVTGYTADALTKEITSIAVSGNEITFFYKANEFDFTVNYYYDGIIDKTATVTTNAIFGSKISEFKPNPKEGYKLNEVKGSPLTITEDVTKNVISVYYISDLYGYTIEYYYDGIINNNATITATKAFAESVNLYDSKLIDGYKLDTVTGLPLQISVDATKNVVRVYYVKDSFNYTEEYFYNNILDSTRTDTTKAVFGSTISYTDKPLAGYLFSKVENDKLTVSSDATKNVIKVYYTIALYDVTVQYYVDGVINNNFTTTYKAEFGTVVNTYRPLENVSLKFNKVEGLGFKVSTDATNNILKVYYITPQVAADEDIVLAPTLAPVILPVPEVAADEDTASPKTSDSADIIFVTSLLGASSLAFIAAKKKKIHLNK